MAISVLAFAIIFPLNPRPLFWPHRFIADTFFCWFFAVTPVTTIVALVKLLRSSRRVREQAFFRIVGWGLIAGSILVNGMVLARLWIEL